MVFKVSIECLFFSASQHFLCNSIKPLLVEERGHRNTDGSVVWWWLIDPQVAIYGKLYSILGISILSGNHLSFLHYTGDQKMTVMHFWCPFLVILKRMKKKTGSVVLLLLAIAEATLLTSSYQSGVWQQQYRLHFVSSHEYLFSLGSLERYVYTTRRSVWNDRYSGLLSWVTNSPC